MRRILVTGAYGFIGQSLCKALAQNNLSVTGTVRFLNKSFSPDYSSKIQYQSSGDINSQTNWLDILAGQDCVVHCAASAHVFNKNKNILKTYNSVNVEGTKRLAEQMVKSKVKRLIFLSSIGVNGPDTNGRKAFSVYDHPNPIEDYAFSKYKAEQALFEISKKTDLEIVILRIPLVYGKGAKGNFSRLNKVILSGIPLPFSLVKNQRSFLGIDNLIDVILKCIKKNNIAGKIFLVSDGEDISTPDLIRYMTISIGRSSRLFPVPESLLKFIGSILGIKKEVDKLLSTLQVDSSETRKILNWKPKVSVAEGIKKMILNK